MRAEERRFASGDFWGGDPHPALAWMRDHDPVPFDGDVGVWGVTRYDDVKAVSTQPAVFSSAGGIRPDTGPIAMMIDMDDPDHLRRRLLVNRGFTPRRVRDQRPKVRAVVDRLVDAVCEQGECDLVADIAAWLPLVMIGDALGVAEEDHPTLLRWSDDLMRGQGQTDEGLVGAMIGAFEGYSSYIAGVVADRRAGPRDDLMSILCHAEVDGDRLDDGEILHESLLILIGGDETTRHVITGGVHQLLAHDRAGWEALAADRDLIPGAVEESLRWVTPIKNMARTATRDVELGGSRIRQGQKLLLLYPSANRDERVFPEPMTFEIRRTPNEHVAFGFGPHFCLGASLARLELTVAFETLLDRLPDLHLVDGAEPARRAANFVSGIESLPVAFTPTAPVREDQ
jgi:cholest-4-en-3-one 26-monooxygenase